MAKKSQPRFGAPIPGMSLTSEPGNRPWEKPPRIVDVDEAISFYVEKLTEPDTAADILDKVEEGMPLIMMADMFQAGAVAKGIHSLDVGVLISPVIIEVVKAMAEDAEVPYVIGTEKEPSKTGISKEEIEMLAGEVIDEEPVEPEQEEMMPAEEPVERTGLMARKVAGEENGI